MVELSVLGQMVLTAEFMAAHVTLEHLFADVVPHVLVETAVVDEGLPAIATFEGSLPCVDP